MSTEPIDAIIFDLGGVIINLDQQRTLQAFLALSGLNPMKLMSLYRRLSALYDSFELGDLAASEFRQKLCQLLGMTCSDAELDQAWNAMLLDIPPERVELLQTLRDRKRLFLLSNTNEIHHQYMQQGFAAEYGAVAGTLEELFEQAYFSYQMRDRKPNASIFQTVLTEHQLDPQRTLYIDDSAEHIQAGQALGLQALHLTKDLNLCALDLLSR